MIFNADNSEEEYFSVSERFNWTKTLEEIAPIYIMPNTRNNLFLINKKIKRGRKTRNSFENRHFVHGRDSFDNLLKKIQVHFLSFLIDFCNDAMRTEYENLDYSFKQINYRNKENVKYNNLQRLKQYSIRDILYLDISKKYKNYGRDQNRILLEKIESSSIWLDGLFQMNYLQLFKYYYNDGKPLNKIFFKEREIILSPKTKSFYCLLEKNKNLKSKIIEIAKRCYLKEDNNNNNNTKLIQFSHKNISSN